MTLGAKSWAKPILVLYNTRSVDKMENIYFQTPSYHLLNHKCSQTFNHVYHHFPMCHPCPSCKVEWGRSNLINWMVPLVVTLPKPI